MRLIRVNVVSPLNLELWQGAGNRAARAGQRREVCGGYVVADLELWSSRPWLTVNRAARAGQRREVAHGK
jgi:hypothetical protein